MPHHKVTVHVYNTWWSGNRVSCTLWVRCMHGTYMCVYESCLLISPLHSAGSLSINQYQHVVVRVSCVMCPTFSRLIPHCILASVCPCCECYVTPDDQKWALPLVLTTKWYEFANTNKECKLALLLWHMARVLRYILYADIVCCCHTVVQGMRRSVWLMWYL